MSSAVSQAQAAADNLNQGGSTLTGAQTDFENAAGALRAAAEQAGSHTGAELATRVQALVDDAEKLFRESAAIKSDVDEWIATLSS